MSKRSVPDKTQASSKQPKVARPWADEFMLNAVGLQSLAKSKRFDFLARLLVSFAMLMLGISIRTTQA
jgi:dihydroorotate dehydrogenase